MKSKLKGNLMLAKDLWKKFHMPFLQILPKGTEI